MSRLSFYFTLYRLASLLGFFFSLGIILDLTYFVRRFYVASSSSLTFPEKCFLNERYSVFGELALKTNQKRLYLRVTSKTTLKNYVKTKQVITILAYSLKLRTHFFQRYP